MAILLGQGTQRAPIKAHGLLVRWFAAHISHLTHEKGRLQGQLVRPPLGLVQEASGWGPERNPREIEHVTMHNV